MTSYLPILRCIQDISMGLPAEGTQTSLELPAFVSVTPLQCSEQRVGLFLEDVN